MTLDTRARRAAQGIHRAVEVMEMSTRQTPRTVERFDRFRAHKSRNRRIAAAVVGIAIPLAVVVGAISLSSDSAEVAGPVAPTPNPPPSQQEQVFVDLQTGEITPLPESIVGGYTYRVSPDGTMLATDEGAAMAFTPIAVLVANVDGTGVRQVTPDGIDAGAPSWSPDGSLLVYQGRDGTTNEVGNLFVVDVTTQEVRQITDLHRDEGWWFMWPSFAPDGRTILFHLPRRHIGPSAKVWDLWSVPVSGGKPVLVRRNAGFGTYSPDGRTMAYLFPLSPAHANGAVLWLVDMDVPGSDPRALVEGEGIWWPSWSPDGTRIAYTLEGDTNEIFVVDVATGEPKKVAEGGVAAWFDDHTLIVGPGCCRD